MKRGLFIFGILLLILAFIAGAAEVAVSAMGEDTSVLKSLNSVWMTLSPEGYERLENWENTSALGGLWGLAKVAMILPGWLLFGIPGFVLLITCSDKDFTVDPDLEESLMLYDELDRQAKKDGYGSDDNILPSLEPDTPLDERHADPDSLNDVKSAHSYLLKSKKRD